jgi:hypothetical protein
MSQQQRFVRLIVGAANFVWNSTLNDATPVTCSGGARKRDFSDSKNEHLPKSEEATSKQGRRFA